MSRIQTFFTKKPDETLLIPYITAGYPNLETTLALMHKMVKSGADIIELGIPFSDPVADGPTIQKANQYALEHGISLKKVLECVTEFRQTNQETPVVLMGYLNPIENMGYALFSQQAQNAGIDGCLIVDCPAEEAEPIHTLLTQVGIDLIYLIAPNTTSERMQLICQQASGYLYNIAFKGITGAQSFNQADVASEIAKLSEFTDLPIAVGFGIKDAQTVRQSAQNANAVIVGSAIIDKISANLLEPAQIIESVGDFIAELKQACLSS